MRGETALWVGLAGLLASQAACFPPGWPPKRPGFEIRDFPYDAGPWLVRLGPTQMAVVVLHEGLSNPPDVTWWARPSADEATQRNKVVAEREGQLWVAQLDNLPPDTELRYAIESELGLLGPFDFRVHRSRNQSFRFAAIGDTRNGHEVHRRLIEQLEKDNIDFLINSGDLVEFGGQLDLWIQFFNIEAPVVSKRPLFASVGNHDNSQPLYFRKLFLADRYADGHRYYYQDWGDVRVIALDSEIEIREGSEQFTFLKRALKDGSDRDLLLVLSLHYPPYSSGEHGSNLEVRRALAPLMKTYGVELVLTGHDHNYERTKPIDGTTYMVAASGGAPIRRVLPQPFTAVFRTEPHYVLFDVEEGRLVGQAVNLQGEVFDSFILDPLPPRDPE